MMTDQSSPVPQKWLEYNIYGVCKSRTLAERTRYFNNSNLTFSGLVLETGDSDSSAK